MSSFSSAPYLSAILGSQGTLGASLEITAAAAGNLLAAQVQPATEAAGASNEDRGRLAEEAARLQGLVSGSRTPPSLVVRDLKTLQTLLERRIENPSPKASKPLQLVYHGRWPDLDPLKISSKKIEAAAERFAREPLATVTFPSEGRRIDIWIHHQRDGTWGLYHCSLLNKPRSRWTEWDRALFEHQVSELGHCRFVSGETWSSYIGPMRRDPDLMPEFRIANEQLLLARMTESPAVAAYWKRMQKIPVLRRWLELGPYVRRVSIPTETIKMEMRSIYRQLIRELIDRDLAGLLNSMHLLPYSLRMELADVLTQLQFKIQGFAVTGLPGITTAWSYQDLKKFGDFLEKLKRRGFITKEKLDHYHRALLAGCRIMNDYRHLPVKGKVTYTLSLWRRHPWFDSELKLEGVYADPGIQVLEARLPNGEVVGGRVLRLFQSALNKKIVLMYTEVGTHALEYWHRAGKDRLLKATDRLARQIHSDLQLDGVFRCPWIVWRAGWSTQPPLYPVTAPLKVEGAVKRLRENHRHPHEELAGFLTGSYEALRRAEGHSFVSPWLGGDLPPELQEIVPRIIEPDPDPEKFDDYRWGYTTTGRSADTYIRGGLVTPDGTRWYHANDVGVGQTLGVRAMNDGRDGLLPLDEAVGRFYLTNLMHSVAGPFGFRTSLGISVLNRGRDEEGNTNGVVRELRRDQRRLDELTRGNPAKTVQHAVQKIARELRRDRFTPEEYARWLARTLGKQFAIMEHFHFDHGVSNDGRAQLHAGNISVAGEIFDFDCARFGPGAGDRYLFNGEAWWEHVDVGHIQAMQKRWARRVPDKASAEKPMDWLSALLYQASNVDFSAEMNRGREEKSLELARLGVDPRKLIREFNVKKWNPFMRKAGKKLRG